MDDYKKPLLIKFRSVIAEHLEPLQILPDLMLLHTFQCDSTTWKLMDLNAKNGSRSASERLIEFLLQCKEPGWFKVFIDALRKNKFEFIADILEDSNLGYNQKVFHRLIGPFYPDLCQRIPCTQILPHLQEQHCLGSLDVEEILAVEKSYGNHRANLEMLRLVTKKRYDWFTGLMVSLKKVNLEDLVEIIEPKFNASLCSEQDVVQEIHLTYSRDRKSLNPTDGVTAGCTVDSDETICKKLYDMDLNHQAAANTSKSLNNLSERLADGEDVTSFSTMQNPTMNIQCDSINMNMSGNKCSPTDKNVDLSLQCDIPSGSPIDSKATINTISSPEKYTANSDMERHSLKRNTVSKENFTPEKIEEFLRLKGVPVLTRDIAKHFCCTKKEINPTMYKMKSNGELKKEQDEPPMWSINI